MRLLVLLIAGLASSVIPSAAPAREYPWCAVYGGTLSGSSNCGFTTRQQCIATVSGIGGFCEPNRFYKGPVRSNRSSRDQDAPFYGPSGSWPSPTYFRD